jgi:imidazolonepropionase-like amidohydrolase
MACPTHDGMFEISGDIMNRAHRASVLAAGRRIGVGCLTVTLVLAAMSPLSAQSDAVAIAHANIVDVVTGQTSNDQTIIVQGNRIRSILPPGATKLAPGTRVLDATGKFVIPGLWDMHVHASGPGIDRLFLPLLVANGITGVREMFGRLAWYDSARALAARGTIVSPRIIGAGHILDGKPAIWPGSLGVATPDEARRVVDSLARAGAAFIKVYSRLSRDAFLAAADEAKKRGLPFAGHVPTRVSVTEASDAGMKSIEHLTTLVSACSRDDEKIRAEIAAAVASPKGWDSASVVQRTQARTLAQAFDADRCQAIAATLKKNGTWMVPTMTVLHSVAFLDDTTLASDPRLAYIPRFFSATWNPRADFRFRAFTAEDWAARKALYAEQLRIVRLLHEAGVQFLAGTDLSNPYIYPGFSLHDELANFVAAGFTPAEALRSATYDPARYFAATDSLGTVAAGKVADLVLLDANPLTDIRNTLRIFAVVLNGRVIEQSEREALLAQGRRMAGGN